MGFEYTLRFNYNSQEDLDKLLRQSDSFTEVDTLFGGYQYRSGHNQTGMPDAEVRIEENGIYFCNNGGQGAGILRDLIAQLLADYHEITIAKLDWE